ncbi:hypothetical protein [Moraxella bovis]|uniref:Uncharacterized protein n=1 Tax=Moraxella bovis TaxID=476 RepID=A0ABY6M6K6_MORBO|nr:hypothetical protein [Moraxella bovis]UZA02919.1 hypothetical protein LP092_13440 [Moraxella bovis]UZA54013.1 hypothetical protein LP111_12660 [Moraxella bovis]UZA57381.1 hypothetical protein LP127_01515 [Moraxella bovis]
MSITIPNTTITDFNIDELTTGTLNGKGTFDILMKAIEAHLRREYENQRIRGTDYANAYVGLINNALQQVTGYALEKAKLPLELQLTEAQIQKLGADTILVTKQGGLVDAQIIKEMLEAERVHLETEHKLPRELAMLDAQIANIQFEAQLKEYELKYLKPVQLSIAQRELALKEKQLAIAEKEIAIKEEQLALARFEIEVKAPAEVESLNAQTGLYKQKKITEQAQTDSSVIGKGSVIDMNNQVLAEQAQSYKNDGKIKVLSIMSDTWKVRRNDDPDEAPVNDINKFNDPTIGTVVTKTMQSVGLIT